MTANEPPPYTADAVTEHVCSIIETAAPRWWWLAICVTGSMTALCFLCLLYLVSTGVGVWGNNNATGWAWDVTNFVFWIGIGHAGTLISAVLFLSRQRWRTPIHRAAEAMTLFAVICAAIYPALHLGRAWMVWFMPPIPNSNAIWPNFRSPLQWDMFAIGTYFTVSFLFWYTGLIPDLATVRDRCRGKIRKVIYGFLALGWRGGNRQWRHFAAAYLLLAGLSTPLVLSVHSVVSCDFAVTVVPGWHTTLFPPYFVAGAIFGGFAMVLTILIPVRALYPPLQGLVSTFHVDKMCKVLLLTGSLIGYCYAIELFTVWYGGNPWEQSAFRERIFGPYGWAFASMVFCNVLVPQLFWFQAARSHLLWVWVIVQFPNVGMWLERFVIVTGTLTRGFLPSSWGRFDPTWVDICTFAGTFGLFAFLFLLFVRWLPMICMFEVKADAADAQTEATL